MIETFSRVDCRSRRSRRPVRLHQVPLLGRHADELLEPTGELLGDTPHIVAQATLALHRPAAARSSRSARRRGRKYTPAGTSGAPVRSASVAGPPGHGGPLAEEARPRRRRRRGPGRASRHTIRFAFSARSIAPPASGPSGTTSMPIASRTPANHSNSSGGSTGSTTTVGATPRPASHAAAKSKPPRCGSARITPLPASIASAMCSQPIGVEAGLHRDARVARQAEQLEPVAAVRRERVGHRAVERAALRASAGGALEVARDEPPAAGQERRDRATGRLGDRASPPARAPRSRRAAAPRYAKYDARSVFTGRARGRGGQGRLRRAGARLATRFTARVGAALLAPAGQHRHPVAVVHRRVRRAPVPRLEELRAGRKVRRLAPHLDEPLHRGDRHEHDHHPERGDEQVEEQRDAEQHHALGPLHEPALGVVAETLGPGPLVGDRASRARRRRTRGSDGTGSGPRGTRRHRRARRASETRSVTESKNAPRGLAWPRATGDGAVEQVDEAARDEPEHGPAQLADRDEQRGDDREAEADDGQEVGADPGALEPLADRREPLRYPGPQASVEHAWRCLSSDLRARMPLGRAGPRSVLAATAPRARDC